MNESTPRPTKAVLSVGRSLSLSPLVLVRIRCSCRMVEAQFGKVNGGGVLCVLAKTMSMDCFLSGGVNALLKFVQAPFNSVHDFRRHVRTRYGFRDRGFTLSVARSLIEFSRRSVLLSLLPVRFIPFASACQH
jgi:hypothetical protein